MTDVLFTTSYQQKVRIGTQTGAFGGVSELHAEITPEEGLLTLHLLSTSRKPKHFTLTNAQLDALVAARDAYRAWHAHSQTVLAEVHALLENTRLFVDPTGGETGNCHAFDIWTSLQGDPSSMAVLFGAVPLEQLVSCVNEALAQLGQEGAESLPVPTATVGDPDEAMPPGIAGEPERSLS